MFAHFCLCSHSNDAFICSKSIFFLIFKTIFHLFPFSSCEIFQKMWKRTASDIFQWIALAIKTNKNIHSNMFHGQWKHWSLTVFKYDLFNEILNTLFMCMEMFPTHYTWFYVSAIWLDKFEWRLYSASVVNSINLEILTISKIVFYFVNEEQYFQFFDSFCLCIFVASSRIFLKYLQLYEYNVVKNTLIRQFEPSILT